MTTYLFSHANTQASAYVRFVNEERAEEIKQHALFIQPNIDQYICNMIQKESFTGKPNETIIIAGLGLVPHDNCVIVGIGSSQTTADYKELGATVAKQLKQYKCDSAIIELGDLLFGSNQADLLGAFVEGVELALYNRSITKKEVSPSYILNQVTFALNEALLEEKSELEQAVVKANVLAQSVNYARELTNMSGNLLTPEKLAFYAEELAHEVSIDVEVLDEWLIAEENMGALMAVGQGSVNPPRMIVLHYEGNPNTDEKWGLVGKGITFDTGGISIKPGLNMEEMISDMAGAAAVLGAVKAIASLQLPVNVIAVIPTAENMPSDRAYKPGDVITTMSGHTIEVVNTDAEGRLVLADGMTTAIKRGATKLIDIATLTGAALVALGTEATAAITNNEELMADVLQAASISGERVWQLPAYPEYKKLLKSDVADMKNSGGRHAGTITGGLFIGHFAEGKPWVHLDIAGPSFLTSARKWETKGGTGVMVRTIFELMNQKSR